MESYIETQLRKAVSKLKGLALKMYCLSFTGLPDRLILLPGARIYFVETKCSEKGPRPRQLAVHKQLRNLGFLVFVIRNNDELKEFLQIIDIV